VVTVKGEYLCKGGLNDKVSLKRNKIKKNQVEVPMSFKGMKEIQQTKR
jgi:hypothetical protein